MTVLWWPPGGDTPDWQTLLDGDESRSSVMYELAREGLERLGLGNIDD